VKTLLKGLAIAGFSVVLAVSAFVTYRLDELLRRAVVTFGPKLTKTSIAVKSVHVSPWVGRASIEGLEVGNPAGFSKGSAFSAKRIRASLDTRSLLTDTIVVDEVSVEGMEVLLEGKGASSNLSRIEKNVSDFAGPSDPKSKPAKNLLIKRLSIKGGKATAAYALNAVAVDLPDIELKNLGTGGQGLSSKEIVSQVLAAVNRNIPSAVFQSALAPVKGVAKTLGQIGALFKRKKK
jgi:hypothetical protein